MDFCFSSVVIPVYAVVASNLSIICLGRGQSEVIQLEPMIFCLLICSLCNLKLLAVWEYHHNLPFLKWLSIGFLHCLQDGVYFGGTGVEVIIIKRVIRDELFGMLKILCLSRPCPDKPVLAYLVDGFDRQVLFSLL